MRNEKVFEMLAEADVDALIEGLSEIEAETLGEILAEIEFVFCVSEKRIKLKQLLMKRGGAL